ncbi:MAG: alpha/beta-type small acid-soluble spore protein [Clostridia bacterium]|nr:alpha/beta-type small acid-soluble spore protein [Clostridia bacterium]
MSNKKSKTAFDQMKYEVANELGIDLKHGYNGDKTSRENGSIGGRITQKVFEQYTGKDYKK